MGAFCLRMVVKLSRWCNVGAWDPSVMVMARTKYGPGSDGQLAKCPISSSTWVRVGRENPILGHEVCGFNQTEALEACESDLIQGQGSLSPPDNLWTAALA